MKAAAVSHRCCQPGVNGVYVILIQRKGTGQGLALKRVMTVLRVIQKKLYKLKSVHLIALKNGLIGAHGQHAVRHVEM